MRSLDIAVIVVYLSVVVAVGISCRGRKESSDEYFTAHGLFSGVFGTILVGLSIAATFFSGVSLIVYISSAYTGGIQIAIGMIVMPLAWVVLQYWFLPRYLAGNWRHPYEIIEQRFGNPVRLTLSAMFGLMRVGWMGVVVYVPALVIMGTIGLDDNWFWPIVLVIGLSSTAYTVVGGIRGVIITDAIQFVVVALGMLFIGGFLWCKLDLSTAAMLRELGEAGHLEILNFSFDPTVTFTFWAVLCGVGVSNLGSYLCDQMALQRYLTASSPKDAARSFSINVIGVLVVVGSLVCVGLLLWLWYRHNPDPALPTDPDKIIPYFIAQELPVGVSGLLIAAILAATMSSITSGVNSLAGAFTNDWLARFGRKRTPVEMFKASRWASLGVGILAIATAGLISQIGSILIASQVVMGVFLGPMLACMMLAITKFKFSSIAMLSGMIGGVAVGTWVAFSPVSGMWVSPLAFLVAILIPVAGSLRRRVSTTN
uniref:sodium:solute symporter family transporter n=1 Tax=Cephaloticoccus sp. TaxID=1985742 RepID=UPI00404A1630